MKSSFTKVSKKLIQGFTLIEMLVVIGIFTILTSVVVFQYGNFNSQTLMTNMAYEIAMVARQAQVYSLGVRGQAGLESFDNRYGVYFDLDGSETEGRKKFLFFIDKGEIGNPDSANGICDDGGGTGGTCFACTGGECLESYRLTRDVEIERICVSGNINPIDENSGECADGASETTSLTVTYQRPNPDAIILAGGDSYDPNEPNPLMSAGIILKNDFTNKRAVIIKGTGQISVEFLNNIE